MSAAAGACVEVFLVVVDEEKKKERQIDKMS